MNIAYKYIWDNDENKYLKFANSLAEILILQFEDLSSDEPENETVKILSKEFEKDEYKNDIEGMMDRLIDRELRIDFAFGKELKLFDFITPDCFKTETKRGKAIIDLMNKADLYFMLFYRAFESPNELNIDFIASHFDEHVQLLQDAMEGKINLPK